MDEDSGILIHHLDLEAAPKGAITNYWMHIVNNAIGERIRVPIMVAKGREDGPILGLTAAIHGNELNGISVIQKLFRELEVEKLRGTIIGVLVVNVPGLLREQRNFIDGQDLNRLTPGNPNGTVSQVYIYRIIDRLLKQFNYHIDLHTASFGRRNTYYVRADMKNPKTKRLARLQNADIIVHNTPNDSTLRGAAEGRGIPSITVELRDPHLFQGQVIEDSLVGIRNVICDLGMQEGSIVCGVQNSIYCESSRWLFTDEGGILEVVPKLGQRLKKGDLLARVTTIFGRETKSWHAPEDCIVIGRSVNPLNQTGSRIAHLGWNPQEIPCVTLDSPE